MKRLSIKSHPQSLSYSISLLPLLRSTCRNTALSASPAITTLARHSPSLTYQRTRIQILSAIRAPYIASFQASPHNHDQLIIKPSQVEQYAASIAAHKIGLTVAIVARSHQVSPRTIAAQACEEENWKPYNEPACTDKNRRGKRGPHFRDRAPLWAKWHDGKWFEKLTDDVAVGLWDASYPGRRPLSLLDCFTSLQRFPHTSRTGKCVRQRRALVWHEAAIKWLFKLIIKLC